MSPVTAAAASIPNLTFASLSPLPPKPQTALRNIAAAKHRENHNLRRISRRDAVALLSPFLALGGASLVQPAPATAFSVGISGPKEWLKEQKRKSSKFLLAPIDASREILRSAYLLLTALEYTEKEFEEVQRLLKSAARDCVPQERNSFVAFQANAGVEVCTFKLILKNAASLLDKDDPVKQEAEAGLNELIRSFSSLSGLVNETDNLLASNRQKVADTLMDTISSLNNFEQGVKDCLDV